MVASFADRSRLRQPRPECRHVRSRSAEKLSPPQKRRRRMERSAVKRAFIATQTVESELGLLDGTIGEDDVTGQRHSTVEQRLSNIEITLKDMFHHVRLALASRPLHDLRAHPAEEGYLLPTAGADVGIPGVLLNQQAWEVLPPYLPFSFNPQASEFVLQSRAGDTGEEESTPAKPLEMVWNARAEQFKPSFPEPEVSRPVDDTLNCKKCDEPIEACICEDIFCRRCVMLATDCRCESPLLRVQMCADCDHRNDSVSLFGAAPPVWAPLPLQYKCEECGCVEYQLGDFYVVQSAKKCGKCFKVGYHSMSWCEGKHCSSEYIFHDACMIEHHGRLYCEQCVENESDPSTDSEETDSEGKEMSSTHGLGNVPAVHAKEAQSHPLAFWGDEEILIWMQVTLKMANAAQNTTALTLEITQRWEAARSKIPPDRRDRLRKMIEDKFGMNLGSHACFVLHVRVI